jgi:hypothetical protein
LAPFERARRALGGSGGGVVDDGCVLGARGHKAKKPTRRTLGLVSPSTADAAANKITKNKRNNVRGAALDDKCLKFSLSGKQH